MTDDSKAVGLPGRKHWAPEELALITADKLTDEDIADRTGRSIRAIVAQRRRLTQKEAMRLGLYPYNRKLPAQEHNPFPVLQHLPLPP